MIVKDKKILTLIGVLVLLVSVVSLTYSFFQAQSSDAVIRDVSVTTHTVDTLTFSVDDDIEIEATQQNFGNGGDNQDGEATATAILTPNSKTGTATKNYYLVFYLQNNPIVYSAANTNQDPELLLQVFNSSDQLVTLTGLGNQVTVDSLTGYDITGVQGIITLLDNHQISASNNTTTTEEWRVVITLINHNFNQNDNTGKNVTGSLVISETNPISYVYWNDNFSVDEYASNEVPSTTYATKTALENAYGAANFSNNNVYIRSTKLVNTIIGHEACLWYNSGEVCVNPKYWGTGNDNNPWYSAIPEILDEMNTAFGTSLTDDICDGDSFSAGCYINGRRTNKNGFSFMRAGSSYAHSSSGVPCYVDRFGSAACGSES